MSFEDFLLLDLSDRLVSYFSLTACNTFYLGIFIFNSASS